jgi:hypothetical protein
MRFKCDVTQKGGHCAPAASVRHTEAQTWCLTVNVFEYWY